MPVSSHLMRPNVLIIATRINSGPGKGLFQLLINSANLNFDYTLCTFESTYVRHENNQFCNIAESYGIKQFFIKQNFPIDPIMILRAHKFQSCLMSNIIQTHGYKPNVIGFFLQRLSGKPWIAFAHGYTDDNRKVRAYNRLDLLFLRYADTVVAVSASIKKLLLQHGVRSSKIAIIHNAVDKNELIPMIPQTDVKISLKIENAYPLIGVVGRLGPEKGHIVFLKAFRDVLREFPHAKALIIGDGQERGKLFSFCNKENIAQNVLFTGHVNNIADYYQIMELLVIPSFSEGLPNVLLEAMMLGIPVVATSVGGIPEVINQNNGVLVPSGDIHKMADAIIYLMLNNGQRALISKNAKETVLTHFDPACRARKITSLYRYILEN